MRNRPISKVSFVVGSNSLSFTLFCCTELDLRGREKAERDVSVPLVSLSPLDGEKERAGEISEQEGKSR